MSTHIDCSMAAQEAMLAKHPGLYEHGFTVKPMGGLPTTDPVEMERLVAWVLKYPPSRGDESYGYKMLPELGVQWHRTKGYVEVSEPFGYVSNGQIILACLLAGWTIAPTGRAGSPNCAFTKGVQT